MAEVMIDAPLLLNPRKWGALRAEVRRGRDTYVLSDALKRAVEREDWRSLRRVAMVREPLPATEILFQVEEVRTFAARAAETVEYDAVADNLRTMTRSIVAAEILIDEWAFLQSHSWIISSAKRTFARFVQAGAGVFELGRRAMDARIQNSLGREPDDPVRVWQRLKFVSRWLAVGAAEVAGGDLLTEFAVERMTKRAFVLLDP